MGAGREAGLEDVREVELPQGAVRYREVGSGPPIVFLHGIVTHGGLWRKVVPELARDFRCIVPDLPLGSHTIPMRAATDLSPPGLATLVADLLEALELSNVTLVANDTGGAIAQVLVTSRPERVGGLVLLPSDAFDNFLPLPVRYLQYLGRVPGFVWLLAQAMRVSPLRRLPIAFGWLTKRPVDREVMNSYLDPLMESSEVRRDLRKVLSGIDPRHTSRAAQRLGGFGRPVLLAWAAEDRLFPFSHAKRLAQILPDARLESVPHSYTFIAEDQPERLAVLIRSFLHDDAHGDGGPSMRSSRSAG